MSDSLIGGLFVTRPRPLVPDKRSSSCGVFLMSDLHVGAPNVDYKLIERELSDAVLRKDRIVLNGDVADLILSKDAKRYEPSALHKRLQGRNDVVNAALDWCEELLAPAASYIDVIGNGNHEQSITKHHSFDFTTELVKRLRRNKNCNAVYGGYSGFVQYAARRQEEVKDSKAFTLFYWHGGGHGSTPSSCASEFDRKSFVEGADVVWFAHKHLRMAYETEKLVAPHLDPTLGRRQWNVRTGSYFVTYPGQSQESYANSGRVASYAADGLLPPQGRGGVRIVVRFKSGDTRPSLLVELQSHHTSHS